MQRMFTLLIYIKAIYQLSEVVFVQTEEIFFLSRQKKNIKFTEELHDIIEKFSKNDKKKSVCKREAHKNILTDKQKTNTSTNLLGLISNRVILLLKLKQIRI